LSEPERIKRYLELMLPPDKVAVAMQMLLSLLAVIKTYDVLTAEEVAIILSALQQ
jgi:hypothetical protein